MGPADVKVYNELRTLQEFLGPGNNGLISEEIINGVLGVLFVQMYVRTYICTDDTVGWHTHRKNFVS